MKLSLGDVALNGCVTAVYEDHHLLGAHGAMAWYVACIKASFGVFGQLYWADGLKTCFGGGHVRPFFLQPAKSAWLGLFVILFKRVESFRRRNGSTFIFTHKHPVAAGSGVGLPGGKESHPSALAILAIQSCSSLI